jgi:hypothetical protein
MTADELLSLERKSCLGGYSLTEYEQWVAAMTPVSSGLHWVAYDLDGYYWYLLARAVPVAVVFISLGRYSGVACGEEICGDTLAKCAHAAVTVVRRQLVDG